MFDCLSICLGYKSPKKWSIGTKFEYVFEASNLCALTQNYDNLSDTFIRPHRNLFETLLHYFLMRTAISINVFLVKSFLFYDDTIVNCVSKRQVKLCLTVCLSEHLFELKFKWKLTHCHKFCICLWRTKWRNLGSYAENCDHVLDTFYMVTANFSMDRSALTFIIVSQNYGIFIKFWNK